MRTKKQNNDNARKRSADNKRFLKKLEEDSKLPNPPPRPFRMVAEGQFLLPGTVLPDFMTDENGNPLRKPVSEKQEENNEEGETKRSPKRKKIKKIRTPTDSTATKVVTPARTKFGPQYPKNVEDEMQPAIVVTPTKK